MATSASATATEALSQQESEFTRLGERAKKTMESTTQSLKNQGEDAWKEVVDYMRQNPGKSLGIAVATGVAFGMSLAALARGKSSARSNIQGLAINGADAWQRVKGGFDDAIGNLRDAFEEAASKFK